MKKILKHNSSKLKEDFVANKLTNMTQPSKVRDEINASPKLNFETLKGAFSKSLGFSSSLYFSPNVLKFLLQLQEFLMIIMEISR